MKKKKYYFAIGNCPALLMILIVFGLAFQSGIKGLIFLTVTLFPLFYWLFIHTSITLYEDSMRFKVGTVMYKVDYEDILDVCEMKWRRPRGNSVSNSHVFNIRGRKSVGIEHNMFIREIAIKIVEEYKWMTKKSQASKISD